MSIADLAAYIAVVLREEINADCKCEGNEITLYFSDGSSRSITIK